MVYSSLMQIITAASHGDVLALVTQVAVLLLSARLLGELSNRLGQPAVIGEILAGVFWGPSIMGKFFPELIGVLIPGNPTQGYLLEAVSLIGAMLLLLMTGFEIDLNFIRRNGKTAALISLGGILLPFITGFVLGEYLPDFLLADPNQRTVFVLFLATAMSISAIPVIAKVLMDMQLIRRHIGQIIIAAGMVDDAVGWTLLSIVVSMVNSGGLTFSNSITALLKVFLFILLTVTVGYLLVKHSLNFVQDKLKDDDRILTLVIALTFAWGALSHALRLEAVFGAFAMGIIFSRMPRLPHHVLEKIKSFALGVFAPIFFAVAGLKMNVLILLNPKLIFIALIVIFVASFGKIVGVYTAGKFLAKLDHWSALSFGAALNARGGMEIIVATIGLKVGILTPEMFSIIVLMAIVTSLMAPLLLKYCLKHLEVDGDELKRLEKEKLTLGSQIKNIHRVLLPIRYAGKSSEAVVLNQLIKLSILEKISQKNALSLTFLSIVNKDNREDSKKSLDLLTERFKGQEIVKKIIEDKDISNRILDEVHKDYDLLILGSSEKRQDLDNLFSPVIDDLVRLSPKASAVVHFNGNITNWRPSKILVPTNGSRASRQAAEFAFLMASEDDLVYLLNVLEQDKDWDRFVHGQSLERQARIATKIIDQLIDLSHLYNVNATSLARIGTDPETEILAAAAEEDIDLIILGTNVKPASERLFLGPNVERILRSAKCPVVILNTI